ncbi:armadillo-type protein, partial [Infundibulicybe gibba]
MVAQTRHGGSPKKKLAFNEKLVTKGLSTDALLKKLKALHTQLAGIDQEHIDLGSLGSIRKELVNTSILLHKDRGVKAYTACCLADILRLYAPDAPYTQAELRDIFQFFFRQLTKGLQGSDASYYDQYFHLLESLSTVKSVVLVCDLPNAEDLIVEVFRDFFNLVKRDLAKKIEIFMTDILVALIDECQSLPTEALETLMSQFIDKNARIEHPAYRLAVDVCNATADKLQRHVCQYFSDIIVSNAREEELEEIRTSHELVKRLHHSCPALLHSVIPQLEEELRAEETELRLIVTQTLGDMFADKGGADLVKKYPTTWNLWLSRKNDRSSGIRVKFVEATRGLLTALPELKKEIEVSLDAKLMDPDEKVRAAVCKVYAQLDYETALHYVSDDVLRAIAGRGLDKKQIVRVEALNCLGKLYSLAYPEIENGEPLAIKQFSWIPNEILQMLTVRTEVRNIIEQVIMDHILPLPSSTSVPSSKSNEIDEVAWTDRLLYTLQYLDEKSVKALLNLSGLKTLRPNIFDHFVEACIKNNGGIIDENEELVVRKLNAVVQHIAATYQDPHKAAEDLNSFAKLNEGRLYKLLKTCMDPQTDLKGLIKATAEFCRRLEQSSASILPTLLVLLRRSSFRIINQSSIPTLIKRIQKTCSTTPHAQTLLTCASKHVPALFKAHIGELAKAIADEKNALLVEVCLQALAGVVKWDGALAPTDKRTNERVARIVLQSNHRHAKFAARILAFSKHRQEACGKAVESIAENIASSDPETSLAHISVLTQFSRFAPESFEDKSDVLMSYLLKSVLMVPTPPNSDDMDLGEEWAEEHELSLELQARILVLKVCRYRGLAHATSEKALETSAPTLKMLATLLEYGGCFNIESPEDPKVMSRMRLQAAISLLHLSTVDTYADAIAPKFLRLALVMQ